MENPEAQGQPLDPDRNLAIQALRRAVGDRGLVSLINEAYALAETGRNLRGFSTEIEDFTITIDGEAESVSFVTNDRPIAWHGAIGDLLNIVMQHPLD